MKNCALEPLESVLLGNIFCVERNDGQLCGMYATKAEAKAKIAWKWKRLFPNNTFTISMIPESPFI